MNFECTLNTTGIPPEISHKALLKSYQDTSRPKYYKKYANKIEKSFKTKLEQNINQVQIPSEIGQTFHVDFKNDGIYFQSSSKDALKYEFGAGNMPPKNFIKPAFIDTANEVSNILITDAIGLYNRYSRII